MFCPKCGSLLPDGTEFCGSCGARMQEEMIESESTGSSSFGEERTELPNPPLPKTHNRSKKVISIVAAVALLIATFGAVSYFRNSKKPRFVYASNDSLYYMDDLEFEGVEFADEDLELWYGVERFSEDGKYFYYMTNEGSDYILCRAELGKVTDNKRSNKDAIVEIDSDVRSHQAVGNNGVLYRTYDDDLYYFNGKRSVKVDSDVDEYYVHNNKHIVYLIYSSGGYTLYTATTSDPGRPRQIAKNVLAVYPKQIEDALFFTKESKDGGRQLYVVEDYKTAERLGDFDGFALEEFEDKHTVYPVMKTTSYSTYEGVKTEVLTYTLCSYKNGRLTPLCEEMFDYETISGGVRFFRKDLSKHDLEDIPSYKPEEKRFEVYSSGKDLVYVHEKKKVYRLTEDVLDHDGDPFDYVGVMATKDGIYLSGSFGYSTKLCYAPYENNTIGRVETVAVDANIIGLYDGSLYYYEEGHDEYDLCVAKKGKTKTLASDIYQYGHIVRYEDGGLLVPTKYTKDKYYDYIFVDKYGRETEVGDDIHWTSIYRTGTNTFVYESNGDLYCTENGERWRIAKDIDGLWVHNEMEGELLD